MSNSKAVLSALGFPALILFAGVLGWLAPGVYAPVKPLILPGLGVIMFGMGLTVKPQALLVVFRHPKALAVGVAAQFLIMPLVGFAVTRVLGLSAGVAVGVIIVGCCPGGTASNVIAYLSRANVALSIGMTTVSTLLAPLLTPLWVLLLAQTQISVGFWTMFATIAKVVLLPVLGGSLVSYFFPRPVARFERALPLFSAIVVAVILGAVVAGASGSISEVGPVVLLAVVLHNLFGMGLGECVGWLAGLTRADRAALTVEVGMQNSGLAAGLAKKFVASSPEAAVAGAIFSVWHNISGSIYAGIVRAKLTQAEGGR